MKIREVLMIIIKVNSVIVLVKIMMMIHIFNMIQELKYCHIQVIPSIIKEEIKMFISINGSGLNDKNINININNI